MILFNVSKDGTILSMDGIQTTGQLYYDLKRDWLVLDVVGEAEAEDSCGVDSGLYRVDSHEYDSSTGLATVTCTDLISWGNVRLCDLMPIQWLPDLPPIIKVEIDGQVIEAKSFTYFNS